MSCRFNYSPTIYINTHTYTYDRKNNKQEKQ